MSETLDDSDRRALNCPKCGGGMAAVRFDQYRVDRCSSCHGLFLDAIAYEHLSAMTGADVVDNGPAHVERRDEVVRIACPRCHAQMIRMVDHAQPHIWYESCPVCFGMYLDAGEFRDHTRRRLSNIVRDLLHPHQRP